MTKPPEEGQVWEWRGFGKISHDIASEVEALPIRNGIRNVAATDIYLISPASEQNVKLRLTDRGWLLKFKLLLEKRDDNIELYHETARWTYAFPISAAVMHEAARLLNVALPDAALRAERFSEEETIATFEATTPAVFSMTTRKVRSQYHFEGGWVEVADVDFDSRRIQSLSLHSPSVAAVQRMVERLHPDDSLTVMNYVEACRRLR